MMTDEDFYREIWRALVILLRAMVKKFGFKPPAFDD
jgi:hypothetical protein